MPDSIREQVLAGVFAIVDGLGIDAKRNHDEQVKTYPFIAQYDGGHTLDTSTSGVRIYKVTIHEELHVKADNAPALSSAVDAIYKLIVDALVGDHTIGGIAVDIVEIGMEAPQILESQGAKSEASTTIEFLAEAWADESDVSQVGP